MNTEEKMMYMFVAVHGEATCSCSWELQYDEDGDPTGVACMKDGQAGWEKLKADILFDYMTRNF